MALEARPMALHWDGVRGWEQTGPDETEGPDVAGPRTLYGIFHPEAGYDLYVWSGPYESVSGMHGADLRSMKRATQLGLFRTMKEAKEVADAHHAVGDSARPPREVIAPLHMGAAHLFADWSGSIEPAPAGVYTIWEDNFWEDNNRFIYVGRAGKTTGADPGNPPGKDDSLIAPKNPLRSRLNSHASGRRSGDQFCLYVCDRFVVPRLDDTERRAVADGVLKLDDLTRDHIRDRYSYRYITVLGGYTAFLLERLVQGGALQAGKPFLNPR
jgi:hypothetical protein